ncbi:hypothetical protein D8674_042324 [Pyrus ussuriensis x Pyrus communis]|uniref:EF-TsMt n=1 Tax=Pyrus ussuriensis x Pyrus communis TaxID=2448454 RepID=A0A5N5I6H9_9ROSA|nr:hypothetical protein D8674_042324 [Pyrus ussuriensis x Pyrus communis]
MKERNREMGSSPPTAEEIFWDYSAPRTDAVHSLTNGTPISLSPPSDHHDSPLSPHHCRRDHRGHITAVENTTIPSSCKRLEAAQKELRRRRKVLASKKSSRMAAEGLLALTQNENKAAIIELNCETDFVARYLSILCSLDTINR